MKIAEFIANYKEAFGERTGLPVVFWYSDKLEYPTEKVNGCFFKVMDGVRAGMPVSLSVETISCGGGKFYTGFTELPERVPDFVSLKERYKETPTQVRSFVDDLGWTLTDKPYLHFARIDCIDSLDDKEGVLFFATPDMLSGLVAWCYFDSNAEDAVTALFGSGCSAVVTQTVLENRRGGRRTFIGLFDPSVRPHVEADILSYTIPMIRFREMCGTMRRCCLYDTHAWKKVRERINSKDGTLFREML